ncbi:MAG TPA: response regulator [Bryobacteraceae bacterium]|jgi:CheY-like chemotaxis protein|nr:response regulator [Bryobacteraceae bacterium]
MTRTVLVVEDAELCRDTLEVALLKLPNLAVHSVTTAEEALQCLASKKEVCALVTDLRLPRMDGYELIEAIRSQPQRSSLPILVISGDSDPRVRARVTGLGADAYFPKPYSPNAVRHKLAELLNGEKRF